MSELLLVLPGTSNLKPGQWFCDEEKSSMGFLYML